MTSKTTINWYTSKNLRLIRLNPQDLKPLDPWSDGKTVNKLDLISHNGPLAFAIPSNMVVLDIDSTESYKRLLDDLQIPYQEPTVQSPNGFHIYYTLPKDTPVHIELSDYPKLEFKSYGHLINIPHKETNYKWMSKKCQPIPQPLLNIITKPTPLNPISPNSTPSKALSKDEIVQYLEELDPSSSYHYWLRIGMSLHKWNPKEGLPLWTEWSKRSYKYEEGICHSKWRSFSSNQNQNNQVTEGTLVYLSDKEKMSRQTELLTDYIIRMDSASTTELSTIIAPEIKSQNFTLSVQKALEESFQNNWKRLTNTVMSEYDLVKIIRPYKNTDPKLSDHTWIDNYVYISSRNTFMHLKTRKECNHKAFDMIHGKDVPKTKNYKPSPSKWIQDNGLITIVNSLCYFPKSEETIITIDNEKFFNTHCMPLYDYPTPKTLTPEETKICELLPTHIKNLIGNESDANILIYWFAHQIQNEGTLLGWVPLIQSEPGMGKTILVDILARILGLSNVGDMTNDDILGSFSDWAMGSSVTKIEELKIAYQSSTQIMDKMKPFITNEIISVREKLKSTITTLNTTNYIAFTNHKDAIPLDHSDRRWCVIFSKHESRHEMLESINRKESEYFNEIGNLLNYPHLLKRYFLDYPIPQWFKDNKTAPHTQSKEHLINKHKFEINQIRFRVNGMDEAKSIYPELLKTKWYVQEDAIIATLFFNDVNTIIEDDKPTLVDKNKILSELGYIHDKKQIRLNGKRYWAYTKKKLTIDQLKDMFNIKGG